jgi:ABC-type oligopeptide transport system substrate-binding subunit
VQEYDPGTFISKFSNGELDLFLLGWIADHLHPDNFFTPILCNPNNLSFGPIDSALCADVQAALAEHNFSQQVLDFQAVSRQVHDKLPLLPLTHGQSPLIYRAELGGLAASPLGLEAYKDVFFAKRIFLPVVRR